MVGLVDLVDLVGLVDLVSEMFGRFGRFGRLGVGDVMGLARKSHGVKTTQYVVRGNPNIAYQINQTDQTCD